MSGLYIDLAVVCGLGVVACLAGMYFILRSTPQHRPEAEIETR